MTSLDVNNWSYKLFKIDFAFQPIVKTHTGMYYGYEALLRNYEAAGFASARAFFDQAYQDGVLPQVDLLVQKKSIRKFSTMLRETGAKLFVNIDNRVLNAKGYDPEKILAILRQSNLPRDMLCFEISANGKPGDASKIFRTLKTYRYQGVKIAINSYGNGFSDLRMLYHKDPDFIKVAPFFIRVIEKDSKKKLLLSNIANMAYYLGSLVVAVGVETREEYQVCRNIGCDMIQGNLVQSPKMRWNSFIRQFRSVQLLNRKNEQKKPAEDRLLINTEVERLRAISHRTDIFEVFIFSSILILITSEPKTTNTDSVMETASFCCFQIC